MQGTDFKLYKSIIINDGDSNGGREGDTEVPTGVMCNVFPPIGDAERLAGGSRLRKLFAHNTNGANEPGHNCRVHLKTPSNGEDFYALIKGDHEDEQGDLTGAEKQHCIGVFAQAASAGDTQIVVDFDDATEVDLADDDVLWLYGANGQMYNTVDTNGVSWNGNQATIDLIDQLNVDYPEGSYCAMVIVCGDAGTVEPTFDSWQENSAAGTYDESTYPPELENFGTVRDDWTITFTSATEFSCTGLYEGAVGTGQISQDFAPTNPAKGNPYFTIKAAGWGGTWAINDTVVFKTYPASQGLWAKEIWPAGISTESENQVDIRLHIQ